MYQPPHFREERREAMHEFILAHPLVPQVSVAGKGVQAQSLPLVLHTDVSERGTSRATS